MSSWTTPDWVKDAVFYQIFPDTFARSERMLKPGGIRAWDALPGPHGYKGGDLIGVSTDKGYIYNEREMLSLAIVDVEHAEPGTEVTLVWGEPDGRSPNPKVERHAQTEISATVAPNPYVTQ